MEFKACKFLSFDQNKFSCELTMISNHLGWERFDPDGNLQLCQMCTKRGRLNHPEACIGNKNKMCHEYEDKIFTNDIL